MLYNILEVHNRQFVTILSINKTTGDVLVPAGIFYVCKDFVCSGRNPFIFCGLCPLVIGRKK